MRLAWGSEVQPLDIERVNWLGRSLREEIAGRWDREEREEKKESDRERERDGERGMLGWLLGE